MNCDTNWSSTEGECCSMQLRNELPRHPYVQLCPAKTRPLKVLVFATDLEEMSRRKGAGGRNVK